MIVATGIELRAGARLLIEDATFRVDAGDRIGLVGRNGAGKTTLTKVLAGEGQPAAGTVTRTGAVGYLPQDPRTGDLDILARDRILSARGLDAVVRELREAEAAMASDDDDDPRQGDARATPGSRRSSRPRAGTPPRPRPRRSPRNLGLPERVLGQPLRHPLRWPAPPGRAGRGSSSPAPRRCCSTSRPTTSTPTRSSGCASTSGPTTAG